LRRATVADWTGSDPTASTVARLLPADEPAQFSFIVVAAAAAASFPSDFLMRRRTGYRLNVHLD